MSKEATPTDSRYWMPKTFAATAVFALTLFITPAAQATGVCRQPNNCTPMAALEHPFARWADSRVLRAASRR